MILNDFHYYCIADLIELLIQVSLVEKLPPAMAKKKNKSQNTSDPSEEATTSTPSPTTSASTSKPKDAKEKAPQPSTSALIICRNKYVFHFIFIYFLDLSIPRSWHTSASILADCAHIFPFTRAHRKNLALFKTRRAYT